MRKECATESWRSILETTCRVERICSRAVGLIIIHLTRLIIRRPTNSGFKILRICIHQARVLWVLRLLGPSIAESLMLGIRQWIMTCSKRAGPRLEHWIARGRVIFSCYWISLTSWYIFLELLVVEILIEYDIVVILLNMLSQSEMLRKETHKFVWRSIISELMRLHALIFQHNVKKLTAVSTSLHRTIDVEIKDRQRFHFDNFASSIAYKKLFDSNL